MALRLFGGDFVVDGTCGHTGHLGQAFDGDTVVISILQNLILLPRRLSLKYCTIEAILLAFEGVTDIFQQIADAGRVLAHDAHLKLQNKVDTIHPPSWRGILLP